MDVESWKSQLRKGAAELAVLSVLEEGEQYGLQILQSIRHGGGLEISEGTIYPLLNRLQRDGRVASRWVEDPGASHPRKYYHLTDGGTALLIEMRRIWWEHTRAMARLVDKQIA